MLETQEAKVASQLYREAFRTKGNMDERFKKLVDYYFELTGFYDSNPNAIMHHFVDLYGPDCEKCGKPYRTPAAKFCAACGDKK